MFYLRVAEKMAYFAQSYDALNNIRTFRVLLDLITFARSTLINLVSAIVIN